MWSWTDNGKEKRLTVVALRMSLEAQDEHAVTEPGEISDGGTVDSGEDKIVPDTLVA